MTRRRAFGIIGGSLALGASGYVWCERRGVTRTDFAAEEPAHGLIDRIPASWRSLLRYAALAPSGHNAQPWLARLSADEWRLGSNRSCWLPKVDPANRELALSIGAFLENLLAAAPSHGLRAEHTVIGVDPSNADLVRIKLTKATEASGDALARLRSRRTMRTGQLPRTLSSDDVNKLTAFSDDTACYFSPASREGRYLAEGTIEANRAQALRDDAQAELAAWIRFSDAEARAHRDGLTQESMEIAGFSGWYVRHFFSPETVMSKSFRTEGVDRVSQQVASCGGWILVTSPGNTLASLIETGRRTERMWLSARERSIAIHPMTQMLEEPPFHSRMAKDLGITAPIQFILRVGYVRRYLDPVSLRRPVAAMVRI